MPLGGEPETRPTSVMEIGADPRWPKKIVQATTLETTAAESTTARTTRRSGAGIGNEDHTVAISKLCFIRGRNVFNVPFYPASTTPASPAVRSRKDAPLRTSPSVPTGPGLYS